MDSETDRNSVQVNLSAVVIAVSDREPLVLTVGAPNGSGVSLPSGPLEAGHRTLQTGLRAWVERQTQCELGYIEQLYTFGDRDADQTGDADTLPMRYVSIAYLALVRSEVGPLPGAGGWRPWYAFFPWENVRSGQSEERAMLTDRVLDWASRKEGSHEPRCLERAKLIFGSGGFPWDEERVLERYEMLYQSGLVAEAWLDLGQDAPSSKVPAIGEAMLWDHRRILATAISRLRSKIKYRPVLFELMPASFTLLELQQAAEALSGVPLHKQNFRRLITQQELVEETGDVKQATGGRPAKLWRFREAVTLERPAPGVRVGLKRRLGTN